MIHFQNYLSAGYFVTKRVDRPAYSAQDILPGKVLSASSCICPFIPDTWCIEWTSDSFERRRQAAEVFKLPSAALSQAMEWVTVRFGAEIGWPNVCFELEVAFELVNRFLPAAEDLVIFGLGLHPQFFEAFRAATEPPPQPEGYVPVGGHGIFEASLRQKPLAEGGVSFGFEPLVFNASLSCSWLCNGLEVEARDRLGIVPNVHGFLDTFEAAVKCVGYISQAKVGAEPGLWLPWLIVDYTRYG